jgi:hypothetical protein
VTQGLEADWKVKRAQMASEKFPMVLRPILMWMKIEFLIH